MTVTAPVASQPNSATQQFETFAKIYQALSGVINNSTINSKLKDLIVQHFDTGFLWAKEAYNALLALENQASQINTVTVQDVPASATESPESSAETSAA